MNTFLKKNLPTEKDTLALATQIARTSFLKSTNEGLILFLQGPLGVGKTTFVRGFLRGCGFNEKVKSPTYTLIEPYDIDNHPLFHFDFYRLNNANELKAIGIYDYFFPSAICLIEWPEKGFPLLPEADIVCDFSFAADGRTVQMESHSVRGREILENSHIKTL